ncbi:DUF3810 domain-containing protein [Herbivorax sp. ANBcel31]|uniref:DUF3810 domain-containing protein n=1 Tax=Herbivorax sp. ANBcel31 TaxID=3069754 RepID=UPI0027B4F555|nr:DUF3810 domain-containing protein [Herbivorax sp. ANBcel31]MDQ2087334.1 DUF3810 domain-containing protein [Herbivorax sp. ANBcel31]
MKNIKKIQLILLAPLGYLIFFLSSFTPGIVEKIYSNGVFKAIARFFSLLTGFIPISIVELLIISIVVFFLVKFIMLIIKAIKTPSNIFKILGNVFVNILVIASITYFSFMLLWGINYQRLPFSATSNLDTSPATTQELAEVCENLLTKANQLRELVDEDENGIMILSTDMNSALKRAHKGYENAQKVYPNLNYKNYGRPKGVIYSEVLSYLGIGGIYSVFTGEANVNIDVPHPGIPFTTCHEIAHQIGFAREDEANFIGYIACKFHPDVDFQYSGIFSALRYASNALYTHDREKYWKLRENFSDGILRDINAISEYWQQYETPAREISSSINDAYLKSNMQSDGVKSYGRMVDLLIAEYREHN